MMEEAAAVTILAISNGVSAWKRPYLTCSSASLAGTRTLKLNAATGAMNRMHDEHEVMVDMGNSRLYKTATHSIGQLHANEVSTHKLEH